MYFQYGQEETEYLSGKDEKLGAVIAQVGRVNREVDTDLFSAVVHHIVGQQISTKAQATIWQRMRGVPLAHCWRQNSTRGLRLIRCLTQ